MNTKSNKGDRLMKKYNTPIADIVEINVVDIITLSAPDENAKYDDTAKAPNNWFS